MAETPQHPQRLANAQGMRIPEIFDCLQLKEKVTRMVMVSNWVDFEYSDGSHLRFNTGSIRVAYNLSVRFDDNYLTLPDGLTIRSHPLEQGSRGLPQKGDLVTTTLAGGHRAWLSEGGIWIPFEEEGYEAPDFITPSHELSSKYCGHEMYRLHEILPGGKVTLMEGGDIHGTSKRSGRPIVSESTRHGEDKMQSWDLTGEPFKLIVAHLPEDGAIAIYELSGKLVAFSLVPGFPLVFEFACSPLFV